MGKTRFDADSNKSQHAEKRMIESKSNLMTKKSIHILENNFNILDTSKRNPRTFWQLGLTVDNIFWVLNKQR